MSFVVYLLEFLDTEMFSLFPRSHSNIAKLSVVWVLVSLIKYLPVFRSAFGKISKAGSILLLTTMLIDTL